MTNKEAIEILKKATLFIPSIENRDYPKAFDMAIKALEDRPTGNPVIKCKDCKHQITEWREDRRMKKKGYWSYGCKYFGELMGYWGFGGNDNEFCSEAEQRDEQEDEK